MTERERLLEAVAEAIAAHNRRKEESMIDPSNHEITIRRTKNGWLIAPERMGDRGHAVLPHAAVAESSSKLAALISEWGAKQENPPVAVPQEHGLA